MQSTIVRDFYFIVLVILSSIQNNGIAARAPPEPYFGRTIGKFADFAHGIKGTVYAIDESTLFIKGFAYDGNAPDAFFWVGNSPRPSPEGHIIPYPEEYTGREAPILQFHNGTDIILRLPMGKRIRDIRWLSVWCRRFTVDFGEVFIPPGLDVPRPRVLPEFKRLAHGLRSSNISILDARTFYIPNLHYDGAGPDAYFWVGNGSTPNIMGVKVPNEKGSYDVLRGYQGEDIEIQLPGNLTVYDIDWLAVWCVEYRHNFGHVFLPKDLDVPPALGQTIIATTTSSTTQRPKDENKKNCKEILDGKLQVQWEISKDSVIIEMFGKIAEEEYMAFGLSGANGRAQMVNGDIVIGYYNPNKGKVYVDDYYISSMSQCDGKNGVCPDERIGGKNDAELIKGDRKNGVTYVKFKRFLQTNEPINDIAIPLDREISVIGAIGPLNARFEANAHAHTPDDYTVDDIKIDFSSKGEHSCSSSLYNRKTDEQIVKPWPSRTIIDENVITARIGPTGGKRGYTAITGHPSWGIAWYLNNLLIPEVYVERGQTYMFIVEGGNDETQPARYHPFYISDSSEGGYGQKSQLKQSRQTIYAGVTFEEDGYPRPTAAGRYCEYQHITIDRSSDIETFEEYKKTLKLACDPGSPAILNWTVSHDTPNIVYYQCYSHNNLGYKIHVVDPGTTLSRNHSKSMVVNVVALLFNPLLILLSVKLHKYSL